MKVFGTYEPKIILSNISSLFGIHMQHVYDVLEKISDYGLIAGGSVVYGILSNNKVNSNHIEKIYPEDIDIFVNNIDGYSIISNLLINKFNPKCSVKTSKDRDGNCIKVSNFVLFDDDDSYPYVQLILKNSKSSMQILNSFDFSYVECGIYKMQLIVTDNCKLALEDTVIYLNPGKYVRLERFEKAIKKGFNSFL